MDPDHIIHTPDQKIGSRVNGAKVCGWKYEINGEMGRASMMSSYNPLQWNEGTEVQI